MSKVQDHSALQVMMTDLNGIARGKRVPLAQASKVFAGEIRMPLSVSTVDIWGRDIADSPLVFESGDQDAVCRAIVDDVLPAPWLGAHAGLIPVTLFAEDGSPSPYDPRHILAHVLDQFRAEKLTPVLATELEFYLSERQGRTSSVSEFEDVLSLQELDAISPFLDDVYATCAAYGIPADAAICECGPGQFEVNLLHRPDALRAADDAVLFKTIVRSMARKFGFDATFMAKPKSGSAGSGLHLHFSVLDEAGHNIFDDGTETGSDALMHALGGCIETMPDCTLIFAPHFNSYKRLRPETHAPTIANWGYENRTAALRIPGGSSSARRIEHRVAGADANPYLVIAAVLAGAVLGLQNKMTPPAPVTGNAYDASGVPLIGEWGAAISAFENSSIITKFFSTELRDLLVMIKRQEQSRFLDEITPLEQQTYAQQL